MRCDQLQPSWKPSFLCCSECSRKIGEYAPDLISCSRVRSEHVLGCSFLCSVTRNVQSKTATGAELTDRRIGLNMNYSIIFTEISFSPETSILLQIIRIIHVTIWIIPASDRPVCQIWLQGGIGLHISVKGQGTANKTCQAGWKRYHSSCCIDLAKLNPNCHVNYSNYL